MTLAASTADLALYLGIYASIVASIVGLWELWSGVALDRPRVRVRAREAFHVHGKQGAFLINAEGVATIGIPEGVTKRQVLVVDVRNRGRRSVQILTASRPGDAGKSIVFADLLPQVPFDLEPGRSKTLVIGADGGYTHGQVLLTRFHVYDGTGRVHPLRERYRQRLEHLWRRLWRRN